MVDTLVLRTQYNFGLLPLDRKEFRYLINFTRKNKSPYSELTNTPREHLYQLIYSVVEPVIAIENTRSPTSNVHSNNIQ